MTRLKCPAMAGAGVIVAAVMILSLAARGSAAPEKSAADPAYEKQVKALASPQEGERVRAAGVLAGWVGMDERSAGEIGRALADEKTESAARVMVRALVKIGTSKAYSQLLSAMKNLAVPKVRIDIVKATEKVDEKSLADENFRRHVEGIWDAAVLAADHDVQEAAVDIFARREWLQVSKFVQRIADTSRFEDVKGRAVFMIGSVKETNLKGFIERFWKDGSSEQVCLAVLNVAISRKEAESPGLLKEALKNASPVIRLQSLTLARENYVDSDVLTPMLEDIASSDKDAAVRVEAIKTLGRFKPSPASEKVFIGSLGEREAVVRSAAARALEKYRSDAAAAALGRCAQDINATVRLNAVDTLIKMATRKATEKLLLFLYDKDKDVQKDIYQGLADIGDRRNVRAIIAASAGADGMRMLRILEALRKIDGEEAVSLVADPAVLGHKGKMVRSAAASALAEHPHPKAVSTLLERLAVENDVDTKLMVIEALGQMKTLRVETALMAGLTSQNVKVIEKTLKALNGSTNRGIVPSIKAVMGNPQMLMEAARTLGSIGGKEAADILEFLRTNKRPEVRMAAIEGIGTAGLEGEDQARYVGVLIDHLGGLKAGSEEAEVVIEAIGGLGGDRAMGFLKGLLGSKETAAGARAAALVALAKRMDKEVFAVAAELAGDPNVALRQAAYEALGELNDPAAATRLLEALPGARGAEQAAVIGALTKYGQIEGVVDNLRMLLKKTRESSDMIAVLQALGRIGKPETAPDVAAFLSDPDERVQMAACRAIANFKYKEAVPPLLGLIRSDRPNPRREARLALEYMTNFTFGNFIDGWDNWWQDHKGLSMEEIVISGFLTHSKGYKMSAPLKEDANVPVLVQALQAYERCCRYNAIAALKQITGETKGYRYYPAYDAAGLEAWGKWLKAG